MATTNAPRPGRKLAVFGAGLVILYSLMAVLGAWKPHLGLDLRGGTSITLTARGTQGGAVTDQSMAQAVQIIRDRVNGSGVAEAEVTTQGTNTIVVQVPGVGEQQLVKLVGQTAELRFRPVIAVIPGGAPQPATPPTPTSPAPTATGSASPQPTATAGQVPPATSPAPTSPAPSGRAVTGGLAAQETPTPSPTIPTPAPSATPPVPSGAAGQSKIGAQPSAEQLARLQQLDCTKLPTAPDDPNKDLYTCDRQGQARFLLGPAMLLGTDIAKADAVIPANQVNWIVQLGFTSAGADKFYQATQELSQQTDPQNSFAIVLDGRVESYPRVQNPIPGGQAQIEGQFTQADAQSLATVLKYGALPLSFDTSEVSTVSPTLGAESLRAGLMAGAIGLALVIVYGVFYYRGLGIVVPISLALAAAYTYALVVLLGEWISFTLTLAGVAGLIVAIGITADSFVIYFERIRDEVRDGRSVRMATETGWTRARRAIISSDVVALFAAVFLYIFSVGGVRGFAFTLGLTTLVDLFTVFMFTHPFVSVLCRTRFFGQGHSWSGLDPERLGAPTRTGVSTSRRRRVPAAKEA